MPSLGNRGAFTRVVSPGGVAFAILSRPRELALAYPGASYLTHVFWKTDKFIGKDEAFVKDCLVHQVLEELVDAFKGMFSQF